MKRLIAAAADTLRFTLAAAVLALAAGSAHAYGPDGQPPEPEAEVPNQLFEQALSAAAADGVPIGYNSDLFEFFVMGNAIYFRICYGGSGCGGTTQVGSYTVPGYSGGVTMSVSYANLQAWLAGVYSTYYQAQSILNGFPGSYGFRRAF